MSIPQPRQSQSQEKKKQVPFSMTIKNIKHMLECCLQHLCTRTARIKLDTYIGSRQAGNCEYGRSKVSTKQWRS